MLQLEDAQQQILSAVRPLPAETIPLNLAFRRFAAGKIVSPIDLPPFDNSAMDGYAVRASDVVTAHPDSPVSLRLSGKIAAGENFTGALNAGMCIRLFTGSPLPKGADAVVMQEDTRVDPDKIDTVLVMDSAKPWENIRFRGEDVKTGATLLETGEQLTVGRISLLAAAGISSVSVARRPTVGLIATGSELTEAGQPLTSGKIYESNRLGLAALMDQANAIPKAFPLIPDTLESTTVALEKAFAECDIVVTSGGVSVGEFDFVKAAFSRIGGELSFWKVAIKPGKPFVFGRFREKLLCGVPGNPVSALVTFYLLVLPALARMQGASNWNLPVHPGTLAEPLVNRGDRRHFVRVKIDPSGKVRLSGIQASHILGGLTNVDGVVDVPPDTTLPAGAAVSVLRWI